MSEQNKALVRQEIKACNDHDLDAIIRPLAADFIQHNARGDLDRQAILRHADTLLRAFPDLRWTIEDMVAEGDKVAVRLTLGGTHQGDFLGVAATGKQVSWRCIVIIRCAGGKIVEEDVVADNLLPLLTG